MITINITSPYILISILLITILLIFLAQDLKRSCITLIPLVAFVILLITHVLQLITLSTEFMYLKQQISWNIALDFVFIFVTYFAYLWVDDIESKTTGKKSISNCLKWLWKKI